MNNNNNANNQAVSSCAVCLDLFSPIAPHRPKILPCGHTTCETCILQWAHRNNPPLAQCPHCRRQFDALKNIDDDVPVNYLALDMMEATILGKRQTPDEEEEKEENGVMKCEITPHCNQPASHRCLQCVDGNQLMCRDHHLHHSSFKAIIATHHPIRIEDLLPLPSSSSSSISSNNNIITSSPPSCSDHIGVPLTIHCWDCTKPVCDRCSMFAHKTHSYTEIHQAAEKIKIDLDDHVKQINDMMGEWSSIHSDLIAKMAWVKSEEEELLKMTDGMCDEMRDAVEKVRTSMKKQVVDVMHRRYDEMSSMADDLRKKTEEGEKMIESSKQVLNNSNSKKEVVTFVHDVAEILRGTKHHLLYASLQHEMDMMRAMIAKIKDEEAKASSTTTRIDLDRMEEAKMMMEEGMRKVMVGCWSGYVEGDVGEDNSKSNDESGGGGSGAKSELEKKQEKIRDLIWRRRISKLSSHIDCSASVRGVTWSHDGTSIYVTTDGEGIQEIDMESGKVVRTICKTIAKGGFISLSKSGDIYVCNVEAMKVHVVSASSGEITRTIGSSNEGEDGLKYPIAVCAVDEWNDVYVVDNTTHCVQVFSMSDGLFIRKFGSYGSGEGHLRYPRGIAIDVSSGLIFVSDFNLRIHIFDRDGKFIRKFGSRGKGDGQLLNPFGIVVDSERKQIIVCDQDNNRLCCFDYDGQYLGCIKMPFINLPCRISMNADRQLAVSKWSNQTVSFLSI